MNSWADSLTPDRMRRVAVVAPADALRDTLVQVADAGCVELDLPEGPAASGPAARHLQSLGTTREPAVLSPAEPDLDTLRREGRTGLLAGEAELERCREAAVRRGSAAALAGWCPAAELPRLAARLADAGGAVVPLRTPGGVDPPTRLSDTGTVRRSLVPLVRTYGTVPYADVDPTVPAGVAYVVMFGMMFGDAGHGLLLLLAALLLRSGRPRRLAFLRPLWPFLAGAGAASVLAGIAYGEFFGPTGVLPVLWLDPLEAPVRLLAWAIGLGAVLLVLAYGTGIVNRWREGGPGKALYAASGVAGATVFLGFAGLAAGVALHLPPVVVSGSVLALAGLGLVATGLLATTGGGAAGALQTGVQLFDVVIRIGSNTVSFARLAAFGLTHAALGGIVWQGTTALTGAGAVPLLAGLLLFLAGNALAFALEALVAGVQALRLEFYELFSRVFDAQGRPFRPWHIPTLTCDGKVSAAHGTEVTS
ncbi:V/A-type H+-transporting ATPase subunit I [Streptomyces sp. SAI-117]|uniref:V-type ATPase 116kDa subunit family protein n=1 Tax=unclassified Streptomyces TaxID=2593676 RepID=UPI002476C30B|nr:MULTISPECIES: V-type ATPase 116kDa subunit family protein [unclassified Streptomyces]MDH6547030.1 V/A-type H+-transporting ATPase subunit I [Streptomyces sp. SAI-041]MDH6566142.1 V/A-type H+-transporting ATPase subunit I [Streptomyces sp. SAI-117]